MFTEPYIVSLTRDMHMFIEAQGLKVRKGQYFQALITQYVDELM